MKKELIIFDTDIGGDCDDAGALALIHALCEKGEAKLLAVTGCYASPYIAGCIDAINTHYNNKVPVAMNYKRYKHDDDYGGYKGYAKPIYEKFKHSYKNEQDVPDTLYLLRKILSESEDNSVTLVATGTFGSLARLVESTADDISPLSGKELITKKLKRTVVMGGRFTESWPFDINVKAEWNIKNFIEAAQTVCEEWPGELVFSSYEIGLWCVTLKSFRDECADTNPAAFAYKLFPWAAEGRSSWDLTAVLYAIRPNADYYNLHEYGKVSVDNEGVTTFETVEGGNHTYLLVKKDYKQIEDVINNLVKESKYYK